MRVHLLTFTRRGGRRNTDNTAYRSKRGAAADEKTGARDRRARGRLRARGRVMRRLSPRVPSELEKTNLTSAPSKERVAPRKR